jgi:hypothetical protein
LTPPKLGTIGFSAVILLPVAECVASETRAGLEFSTVEGVWTLKWGDCESDEVDDDLLRASPAL